MRIERYEPERAADWDAFVRSSRNGTFLFERGYMDYHADRFRDYSLLVWQEDELIAALPAHATGDRLASHDGLSFGGVVIGPRMKTPMFLRVFETMLLHLQQAGLKSLDYKTIPHIYHRQPAEDDRYALFRLGAELTRRDLLSVVTLDNRLPYQHRRERGIKKARSVGVVVQQESDFSDFWSLLAATLADRFEATPVHSLDEMHLLHERFPVNVRLHTARSRSGELLAGVVSYVSHRVVHAQYIAAAPSGRDSARSRSGLRPIARRSLARLRLLRFRKLARECWPRDQRRADRSERGLRRPRRHTRSLSHGPGYAPAGNIDGGAAMTQFPINFAHLARVGVPALAEVRAKEPAEAGTPKPAVGPSSGRATKKLSVIVPVYFNEGSLALLFKELQVVEAQLNSLNVELELIFVDDGSGDGSYAELVKIKAQRPATRIVKLSRNFGAVHSSKTGYQFVTGDGFLVIAADLQDPPSLIVEMTRRWLAGSKFVMCVREKRNDPVSSTLFTKVYYRLLRAIVVPNYPDGGYDLALMDKAMLPHMQTGGKNINPNVFAFWLGFKPDVIPYERRKRVHGKSRWTFRKKLNLFLDTMLGFSIVPLRLISLTGIVVSGIQSGIRDLRCHQRPARPIPRSGLRDASVDHLVPARPGDLHAGRDRRVPLANLRRDQPPAGSGDRGNSVTTIWLTATSVFERLGEKMPIRRPLFHITIDHEGSMTAWTIVAWSAGCVRRCRGTLRPAPPGVVSRTRGMDSLHPQSPSGRLGRRGSFRRVAKNL